MKKLKDIVVTCLVLVGALTLVTPAALACGDAKPMPAKTDKADQPTDVAIPVQGMTCGGCANKVQVALMKLTGVLSATVDFKTSRAVVHFDAAKISTAALIEAITKAGYKTGSPEPVKTTRKS